MDPRTPLKSIPVERAQSPDHTAMGDKTCNRTKVPPGLPFVSNVQSKTHQDSLPAVSAAGSAEEMETNEVPSQNCLCHKGGWLETGFSDSSLKETNYEGEIFQSPNEKAP